MRFGILGPTEARAASGERVAVGGPMVRALLALLLLDAGRVVQVERLIDGLYGEAVPREAGNALQSQVSRLRRMIGSLVESHPAGYRLAVPAEDVDVHLFERLAAQGRAALAAGDHRGAAAQLRAALDLWRGPALPDVGAAPFAAAQIARLEELRITAVEERVEADLAIGALSGLVAELRELVHAHPLRERLRGQLMRALNASGRQGEALELYEETRRVLATELGADPSAELAAVYVAILRRQDTEVRPAVRLPAQLTSFVGRADELEHLSTRLADARLVTLVGPGGVGKTRLAIEAAARQPMEACLVELAPVTGGDELAYVVLAALGLREGGLQPGAPAPDPLRRLTAALAGRDTLLILDNCEHVIVEAARLAARLLSDCPGLRILTTSREPLGITGESLLPLAPLAADALTLFAHRAAAVAPGCTLDAAVVTRICELLDGLPLAIELAAARLRTLPLEELADRLGSGGRFAVLSRGSRTAQPRHQTLRGVVAWSWELLDADEQALARRFTVFAGAAPPGVADHVCALPSDLLTSLVDKSFIELVDGRYRMLETIKAYCAQHLRDSGEEDAIRTAHLRHYLDLAEAAEPELRGADQLTWLGRLDAAYPDLHAAARWAISSGVVESALRLVAALSTYWVLRGRRSEAARLARSLLERLPDGTAMAEEYVLCVLHAGADGRHVEAARAIMEELAVRRPILTALWGSFAGITTGDPSLTAQDPWSSALIRLGLGYRAWMVEGAPAAAEREFTLALAGFRALGERWGMSMALTALAEVSADPSLIEEALELTEELGAHEETAALLCKRAHASGSAADFQRAAELSRRAGAPDTLALAHHGLAELARRRGDAAEARRLCELALSEAAAGWFTGEEIRARVWLCLGRLADSDHEAEDCLGRALTGALAHHHLDLAADAVEELAARQTHDERVALLLGAASSLRGTALPAEEILRQVVRPPV